MTPSFIFGGNTGLSYDDLQRRRLFAENLLARGQGGAPKTALEGLNGAAQSILGALMLKKVGQREDEGRKAYEAQRQTVLGSMFGYGQGVPEHSQESAPATDMGSPAGIGRATMAALGKGAVDPSVIRAGLIGRGLPAHVADGFVMNFHDESGMNPGITESAPIVPGSRGGYGLAQWTGPRREALETYARDRGMSVTDPNLQMDFLMTELQGPESAAARKILAAPDAGAAASAIVTDFLRPAPEHRDRRVAEYTGLGGVPMLSELMSSPYATEGDRMLLGKLMEAQIAGMQPPDPMRALELEKAQIELDQLRSPKPGFRPATPQEAETYGGAGQIGPDGRFYPLETDNAPPDGFQAKHMTAIAGGLVPGTPEYQQFMLGSDEGEEYGLTVIWGRDKDGKAVPAQVSKAGTIKPSDVPDGWTPDPSLNARMQAEGRAIGAAMGEAIGASPTQIANADIALQGIDEIRNHPGIDRGTGLSSVGNSIFGTKGYAFQSRVNQLAGGAFLTAIQQLQGMGALSNAEGQTATAAIARLQTGLNRKEFDDALNDYQQIVEAGRKRAEDRLRGAGLGPQVQDDGLTPEERAYLGLE